MSNKQAFTLVEIIVVMAIIVLVLGAVIFMGTGAATADKDVSGLEEYYHLKARLDMTLKNDIRNAREMKSGNDNSYQFVVVIFDEKTAKPVEKIVSYRLSGTRKTIVERREEGRPTQTWDFTRFAGERKVKLEISNFN